jgi:ABC-type sugar transport system ATPase subunit
MIVLNQITIQAGDFHLREVSFRLQSGSYGALMGRTGCGKTTLLEAIAGLKPVQQGSIQIDGVDVTRMRPASRGIGYVPQDGALFNTMTVRDNLGFALEIRHWTKKEIAGRVGELADWLDVSHLLERRPYGLSGGERQRVALGRALAFHPAILLMDEPLSAVDETTREDMYELLRRVRERTNVSVLHVTHNPAEARELADIIFVLENGTIRDLRDTSTIPPT